MHWNDPSSKQHQVSLAIESTLCDQFPFPCDLVLSSVNSLTTSLELWRRHNFPILYCVVECKVELPNDTIFATSYPFPGHQRYVTLCLSQTYAYIISFSSITNFLCPTPCDRVYNLRFVPLSLRIYLRCISPFGILLRFWPSSRCNFVFRLISTAFLRELQ